MELTQVSTSTKEDNQCERVDHHDDFGDFAQILVAQDEEADSSVPRANHTGGFGLAQVEV